MKHFLRAFAVLCVFVAMLAALFFKGGVAKASAPPFKLLSSISAVSAHNAWAVGTILTTGSNVGQVLIEHWDGTAWSIVPGGS